MFHSKVCRAGVVGLSLCSAVACSAFGEEDGCELGAMSCDGRSIRICAVDVEGARSGDQRSAPSSSQRGSWTRHQDCEDDPVLGTSTCGMVEGKPACVRKRAGAERRTAAATLLSPSVPASWLRVDVSRQEDAFTITGAEQVTLPSPPLSALRGPIAAVSYVDGAVLDATLVGFTDPSITAQSVWLRSEGATRVALVAPGPDGTALAEIRPAPQPAAAHEKSVAPSVHHQALGQRLPAGLVLAPNTPPAWQQVLVPAFALVPPGLMSLVREVHLAGDLEATAYAVRYSAAEVEAQQSLAASSPPQAWPPAGSFGERSPVAVISNRLLIALSRPVIERAVRDRGWLALEITRALAMTYGRAAVVATQAMQFSDLFGGEVQTGGGLFASTVETQLQSRLSPLLGKGEALDDAWGKLHQSAVALELSRPYVSVGGQRPRTDEEAVHAGFASAAGASDPIADFADYAAHVSALQAWPKGPCAALRAKAINELGPELILPLAKLSALRGLGVITGEQLQACTGDMPIGGDSGLVFYTATGERLSFEKDFQAVHQPFFAGQVHMSWVSHRGYVSTSLDIGYRGALVPALRLNAQVGTQGRDLSKGDDAAAVLAILNTTTYQAITATGGIVTATQIERDGDRNRHRDRLEALAFFVTLSEPLGGSKNFPLVTAKANAPVWGDAP
jgi:hypothetical protein